MQSPQVSAEVLNSSLPVSSLPLQQQQGAPGSAALTAPHAWPQSERDLGKCHFQRGSLPTKQQSRSASGLKEEQGCWYIDSVDNKCRCMWGGLAALFLI